MRPINTAPLHLVRYWRQQGYWRPSWGITLLLIVVSTLLGLWLWQGANQEDAASSNPKVAAASSSKTEQTWNVMAMFGQDSADVSPSGKSTQAVRDGQDPSLDLSHYVPSGQIPSMHQVIDKLHEAGIFTGLGAFNPPGTNPPLVGLAVPENFALPPGYVRHYQTTDDGQSIEPILMFSPDQVVYDANHQPITLPENRVVPPELAPPGFPLRRIVIPPPQDNPA